MNGRALSFDWRELSINNLVQEVDGVVVSKRENEPVSRSLARDLTALLRFASNQDIDLGHAFAALMDEGKVIQ